MEKHFCDTLLIFVSSVGSRSVVRRLPPGLREQLVTASAIFATASKLEPTLAAHAQEETSRYG